MNQVRETGKVMKGSAMQGNLWTDHNQHVSNKIPEKICGLTRTNK